MMLSFIHRNMNKDKAVLVILIFLGAAFFLAIAGLFANSIAAFFLQVGVPSDVASEVGTVVFAGVALATILFAVQRSSS